MNANSIGDIPIRSKVFGCLEAGYLHVIVGHEIGHTSGAPLQRIETIYFPVNCRMPNTIIEITFDKDWEIAKIELAK